MARIRTIKPEFPEDETLGHVCRDARLMFVLLWTICDDFGRFRASASYLRGQLFPYDEDISNKEVNEWLSQLCLVGRTKLYRVGNQAYGYVVNWSKHQRIDNASKSSIPEPLPEQELSTDKSNVCEIPRNSANLGGSPLDRKGIGIGKEEDKSSRGAKAPRGQVDTRFAPVKDAIEQCCIRKNVPFVWGAAEGTQLSTWLKSVPSASLGQIKEMVWNRFHSKDPPGRRPCKWIGDLSTWATGPTDRFNKEPDGQGTQTRTGQVARAEERERAAIGNIAKALQNRIGEVDGSNASAVSAFSGNGTTGDVVAGGLGATGNGVRSSHVSQGVKSVVDEGEILPATRGNPDRVRKHGAAAGAEDS